MANERKSAESKLIKRIRRSDSRHEDDTRRTSSEDQPPKLKKTKSLKITKSNSDDNLDAKVNSKAPKFSPSDSKTSPTKTIAPHQAISPIFSNNNLNRSTLNTSNDKLTSPKSSFISNASFNQAPSVNSSPNTSVVVANVTNPIGWTTGEVCKYVVDNKFDPALAQLIQEHVRL